MMRRLTLTLTTLTVLFGLIGTYAYAVHHDEGKNNSHGMLFSEKIAKKLQLTDEQQNSLKAAQEQTQQLRAKYEGDIKDAHQTLMNTITEQERSDSPDLAKVIAARKVLTEKVGELHNQLLQIELGIYNQLTPKQKKIVFTAVQERMEKAQKRMQQKRSKFKSMFAPAADTGT